MKYIIAFVLLGLITYAGGFILLSGINDSIASVQQPVVMSSISSNGYISGMYVKGEIDQQVGKLGYVKKVPRDIMGIEFGEPLVQQYYVIPTGGIAETASKQSYMLICVTTDEDVTTLDELIVPMPCKSGAASEKPRLEFEGLISAMDAPLEDGLIDYLLANWNLVGLTDFDIYAVRDTIKKRVCPYTIFVRRNTGGELIPVIVGAALTAVGAGGIILLAVKKYREYSGY